MYGSKISIREVQGSVFSWKKCKKRYLSQLGIEEEFVQLSRQLLKILCGGQPSIGEAKLGKKMKNHRLSQLGTEEKSSECETRKARNCIQCKTLPI